MDSLDSSYPTVRDSPGDVETGPSVRYPTVAGAASVDAGGEASTLHVVVTPLLFGRYRRIRELGRGGMGVVWLAQDEVLGIPVALKLLPEEISRDAEELESLRKEVLRGIALTHSGIVRVYSFERDAAHTAIVMEYIDGESLSELKVRQPDTCFDAQLIRPWLEQLCAVLDYAHLEARIAHRDLKPRNLMVTREGRLKVADFGIASSLAESMSSVSIRTDAAGTPPFMSPQQARGARPTSADDIYALGATIYDLLTSRPPFFRGDILGQVMHEVPPSMNERRGDLGIAGRAPIPAAWERVVAACLAKDPTQRPPSGAALLQLLDTPIHAMVPYEPRPAIPLETLKLNVTPVAEVQVIRPRRREVSVIEADAYPLHRRSDGILTRAGRATASMLGDVFSELFLWARRIAMVLALGAAVAGVIYLINRMPKAAPASAQTATPNGTVPNTLHGATLQPGSLEPVRQPGWAQPSQPAPQAGPPLLERPQPPPGFPPPPPPPPRHR